MIFIPLKRSQFFHIALVGFCLVFLVSATCRADTPIDLTPAFIADQAVREGNVVDGAFAFFSPQLGCARCHEPNDSLAKTIGPSLSNYPIGEKPSDVELVEAITNPSKRIRKGYETHQLITSDGRALTGRVIEQNKESIRIQDSTGQFLTVPTDEIETQRVSELSLMPTGLAEQIGSRQQLVNLVRYLIEIRDANPERLTELRRVVGPVMNQVPDYESNINHAELIRKIDDDVLKIGEAIYGRVCANCHGTFTEEGSLPTSPRFAEAKLKNGSDPYSMYRTLTYGFGMMTPQTWMVPQQKYAVVHYIRQRYFKELNPSQWTDTNEVYVSTLPKGSSLGPEPSTIEPWSAMDYGQSLTHTYEISNQPFNIAYKGIAIRLGQGSGGVAQGDQWMIFDTDTLRWAAGWKKADPKNRFIDWKGVQFDGQHNTHPKIVGDVIFSNANGPGWAHPLHQTFDDRERVAGRDNRRYGPLPRDWGQYVGQYRQGNSVIVAYRIGDTMIYERPSSVPASPNEHSQVFLRSFWVGHRRHDLLLRVADLAGLGSRLRCASVGSEDCLEWHPDREQLILKVKAGAPFQFLLGIARDERANLDVDERVAFDLPLERTLLPNHELTWLEGGPSNWTTSIPTVVSTHGQPTEPFSVDTLHSPTANPWACQMRFTGLDFFSDGRIAVCTWDGDVWVATETRESADRTNQASSALSWKRIASGLFQPLGLKIVQDQIYVTCRDQLARLHDLNRDGETDFYECFNNDHQVTEHFHEFAMGLQRDQCGNFYYAKSARHALKAIVPHHGTLLRVSSDGQRTDIVANGFRAANGVCLNPDGSFFVTDQEGHWIPKNRINLVKPNAVGPPRFYGNLFGYTSVTDSSDHAMEQPLCWITNDFDRSPGELLWVNSDKWGALNGGLLELSYGTGRIYLVLLEKQGDIVQGGMIALPIPDFPTGVMRGRFHPADGHLYACGMFAWAGNQQLPGGFYRIRKNDSPLRTPIQLQSHHTGVTLNFLVDLEPKSITKENVSVKIWSLERTANYGSRHINERDLRIEQASLDQDKRTVHLNIPSIQATKCMEIRYQFNDASGQPVAGKIHNTIHTLSE